MSDKFVTGDTLDRGAWRVTVAIPESDRRLVYWPKLYCKLSGGDFTITAESREQAYVLGRELRCFYVHFGIVARNRIRAVDHAGPTELAEVA